MGTCVEVRKKKTSQKRKHGDELDIKIWMYIWAMNIWNIFIYIYTCINELYRYIHVDVFFQ